MKDLQKYERYAEKISIFHGLTPEEVDDLLHRGKILHARQGETVFHEGMLGNNLFIVLSGKIGIYVKNQLIGMCHVGDAFGEMAVLNKRPRSATATALAETRLLILDEKQINEILEKHVAVRLLLNIVHVVSERLEGANTSNVEMRRLLQRNGIPVPQMCPDNAP